VDEKGRINTANISAHIKSGEFQTDHYIMRGDPLEIWEPRFTYHGFRYAQITGYPGEHSPRIFKARVVHTDLPVRGEFSCSDPTVNAIQQCARRSTLTNYHGIPTDCPHREKNGWTGDAQLSAEQMLLNFDPRAAYRKWLRDIRDAQRPDGSLPSIVPTGGWGFMWGNGPAWDSALVLIPWYQYLYAGDTVILEENYDAMARYVDYLTGMEVDGIVDFGLGDWCPPGGNGKIKCPVAVTDTAYYHVCARLVSRVASVLGREEDAAKYAALADRIRDSFRREFVVIGDGTVTGSCQTSLACALHQGMIGDEEREIFLASLLREIDRCGRHIDCGILGAKYVLHVLTDSDRVDTAFDIVTQRTYPGWGNWIERGATTLWESWEGDFSQNHHMFSDVSAFFYRGLAGIRPDPDEPGFRHVILRPRPAGGLAWVNAWHEGPYGRIVSNWRIERGVFVYNCVVPPGSRATLTLPSAEGVTPAVPQAGKDAAGRPLMALESGRHMFSCRL
jgi:alpha-L-rhamnosidase